MLLSQVFLTPGDALCANHKFILESSCGLLPGCFVWPAICLAIHAPSSGDRLFLQISWWEPCLEPVTLVWVTGPWKGSEDERKMGFQNQICKHLKLGEWWVVSSSPGSWTCAMWQGDIGVYDIWGEKKIKTGILKEWSWQGEGEASSRFSSLSSGQVSLSLTSLR